MPSNSPSRRIAVLREDVSRKIAAGEVIDRPFSVVRELLDNAIDAGSNSIDVFIEQGGLSRIRVVDDGAGMSREDLYLCTQRHATSKIRTDDDLYRVTTLGFRGEALASIAACARLDLVSRQQGEVSAHRLQVQGGEQLSLTSCQGRQGTAVEVFDLFFNMPARKKFLKSNSSEAQRCRQVFLDKALPHPDINFRLTVNGKLKTFFPATNIKERIETALSMNPDHLHQLAGEGLVAVAARPELNRRDRKMIQIFVNRRRVFEYALVQAVEFAYSEYLPGGLHPIVFLFIEQSPDQVDFNVHPAKKEVRFRDLESIRRLVLETLRPFLMGYKIKARGAGGPAAAPPNDLFPPSPLPGFADRIRRDFKTPADSDLSEHRSSDIDPLSIRYRGQLFGLFLLLEHRDAFYLLDQHAAHERVLYERFSARSSPIQELLMPIRIELGPEEESRIADRSIIFEELGINLEKVEPGAYEIKSLPEVFLSLDEKEMLKMLLAPDHDPEEAKREIYSMAACRLALKEGQDVDAVTARELFQQVLTLDNARCPHGRPLWVQLTKDHLYSLVGRKV